MDSFFRRIYSQEEIQRINQFDRKNPHKYKDKFEDGKDVFQLEEREPTKDSIKYGEKVREYSKYLIGRKISKNIKPFSKKQI